MNMPILVLVLHWKLEVSANPIVRVTIQLQYVLFIYRLYENLKYSKRQNIKLNANMLQNHCTDN